MFNICVISDDRVNSMLIKEQLNTFFLNQSISMEINILDVASLIAPKIWKGCNYDLAVLDISNTITRDKLLTYSTEVRKASQKTKVIFVSDDLACVLDIFYYNPDYFIYKPQIELRLISAVKHLFEFDDTKENNLIVCTRTSKYVIPEKLILYFEHYQHNTKIVCEDRVICCREKLNDLQKKLTDKVFARCHCSFIVNLRQVKEYSRTQLILTNGDIIPCSRANQKIVRSAFEDAIPPKFH